MARKKKEIHVADFSNCPRFAVSTSRNSVYD